MIIDSLKADVLMDPEERAKIITEGTIFRAGGLGSLPFGAGPVSLREEGVWDRAALG